MGGGGLREYTEVLPFVSLDYFITHPVQFEARGGAGVKRWSVGEGMRCIGTRGLHALPRAGKGAQVHVTKHLYEHERDTHATRGTHTCMCMFFHSPVDVCIS